MNRVVALVLYAVDEEMHFHSRDVDKANWCNVINLINGFGFQ